ncbi:MAG: efflux transporter outer membrane subunit [Burkholderiaceae bacterium]|nr:efflux transporter outer membrane subunit [Burkholderiaceae bacterium]
MTRANGPWAVAALALVLALAGCTVVGPDYRRPPSTLPAAYSQPPPAEEGDAAPVAGDWWLHFGDATLSALIATALERNSDLHAAAARIEEADAAMREAGASFLPQVNLGGSGARSQTSAMSAQGNALLSNNLKLSAATSYEIDFWGRLRRGSESARAQALASRHARDVVALSIAGLTAQAWYALRSLDQQIAIVTRTLATRDEGVRIARARLEAGTASGLELQQAQVSRSDAAIQLRDLNRQRSLAMTQIARLSGQPGLELARTTDALRAPPLPPLGLPSELLSRRPDLRQAEEQLIAANAQIGVARAAMLPSISLTGSLGAESAALASLLTDAGARIWSLGFGLALPIFDGGRLEARSDQAAARARQALAAYQGAAQSAFREVSDALIAAQAARRSGDDVDARAAAARRALELATLRHDAGYSGYLELLDAQRSANGAELEQVRNRQARLNASIDLFKALSGGWPDRVDAATRSRSGSN